MDDRADLPDETPFADAAEQSRPAVEPTPDEEAAVTVAPEVPLEAAAHDWQEQHEAVDLYDEEDMVRD